MSRELPTEPVPVWCTTSDVYDAVGEKWHNKARKLPPEALATSGYNPDEPPGAQVFNYQGNAVGQWLEFVSDLQLQNLEANTDTGSVDDLVNGTWSEGLGQFFAVGDNGKVYRSTDGILWLAVTTGVTSDFFFTFATPDTTVVLSGGVQVSATTTGSDWQANIEDSNDKLSCGVYEPDEGRAIVGGGTTIPEKVQFLYSTTDIPGASDMSRATGMNYSGQGGGDSTAILTTFTGAGGMFMATTGAGRTLCLVNAIGGSSGAVDMFISTDGGETWAATLDTLPDVTSSLTTGVRSLAYDAHRALWVAVTGDGRVFTSPTSGETWTLVATLTGVAFRVNGFLSVGTTWVAAYVADSADRITWSPDAGVTWYQSEILGNDAGWLTYSNTLRMFMYGEGTNVRKSLKMGGRPTLTVT